MKPAAVRSCTQVPYSSGNVAPATVELCPQPGRRNRGPTARDVGGDQPQVGQVPDRPPKGGAEMQGQLVGVPSAARPVDAQPGQSSPNRPDRHQEPGRERLGLLLLRGPSTR